VRFVRSDGKFFQTVKTKGVVRDEMKSSSQKTSSRFGGRPEGGDSKMLVYLAGEGKKVDIDVNRWLASRVIIAEVGLRRFA